MSKNLDTNSDPSYCVPMRTLRGWTGVALLLGSLLVLSACSGVESEGDQQPTAQPDQGTAESEAPDDPGAPEDPGAPADPVLPAGSRTVPVGFGPVGVAAGAGAVGAGAVWVAESGADSVSRIDPTTGEITATVAVPQTPLRVAVGLGSIWVTSFSGEQLVRLDPSGKVRAKLDTGAGPEGVTTGLGSVWLVAQDAGRLLRVDPESTEITQRIRIGVGARLVTTGAGRVFVSHFKDDRVLAINPVSGEVQRSKVLCSGPQGMALVKGLLWVACTFDDQVVALDPQTLAVRHTVEVPGAPDAVRLGPGGEVLVLAQAGPALVHIDPVAASVTDRSELGVLGSLNDQANLDLVVAGRTAWVSSFKDDVVIAVPLG